MSHLHAIPTPYNGYIFRSRVESRWALWLDSLGIRYEYEKEGYDLGPAGWYIPDFWLPDYHIWLEIKGATPTANERYRARFLARDSRQSVYIFSGDCWVSVDILECVCSDLVYGRLTWSALAEQNERKLWAIARNCKTDYVKKSLEKGARIFRSSTLEIMARRFVVSESDRVVCGKRILNLCPECEGLRFGDARLGFSRWCMRCGKNAPIGQEPHPRLMDAFRAARAARFERERRIV